MKVVALLVSLLLPLAVFSKELISSDDGTNKGSSNLRTKKEEAPRPLPILVKDDFVSSMGKEKKLLMQTLLPSALMTKIKKITESLCEMTPDEVLLLDDTDTTTTVVYGVLLD